MTLQLSPEAEWKGNSEQGELGCRTGAFFFGSHVLLTHPQHHAPQPHGSGWSAAERFSMYGICSPVLP